MATAKKTRKAAPSPAARKPAARKTGATRPAAKPTVRPVVAPAAARPEAAKSIAAPKLEKLRKAKLVRDSFTIPKAEYMVLQDLKLRAARSGAAAKKSELLRAGVTALAAMNDAAFAAALRAVTPLKTGRPAKDKD